MKTLSRKLIKETIAEEFLYISKPRMYNVMLESREMSEKGYSNSDINVFIHENILEESEEYDTSAFVEYLKRTLSDLIVSEVITNIDGVKPSGFMAYMVSQTVPSVIMNTSWSHLKSIYRGDGVDAFADILVDTMGDLITGPGLSKFADAMGLEVHAEITKFLAAGLANMLTQGEESDKLKQSIAKGIRSLNLEKIFSTFSPRDLLSFIPGIQMPDKLIGTDERGVE